MAIRIQSLLAPAVCAGILWGACAWSTAFAAEPKLIVQITADQLRGDLLERYRSATHGGLARMESQGFWIRRGDVDHGITLSFPGHASLTTGMYPAHHGLVSNECWAENDGHWGEVDVGEDYRYPIFDSANTQGASPQHLLATTLGEWVKAADPHARSVALGTGTRIPLVYGGHKADEVYWFDSSAGKFTTTRYYEPAIAPWVLDFDASDLPKYESKEWTLSVPPADQGLLRGTGPVGFPHVYPAQPTAPGTAPIPYGSWFASTPLKDEALFALAERAVSAEKLGQRGSLDYLAIDVDSTDEVGHRYGPSSLEQFDTVLRIDRSLGHLLDFLDRTLGNDKYVVVFSADHGAAEPPENGGGGRRVHSSEIEALLDKVQSTASSWQGTQQALVIAIRAELEQADFVAASYSKEDMERPSKDPYVQLYQRSYHKGCTPDFPLWTDVDRPYHPARYGIFVRFKEGDIFDKAVSVHGSPYTYDRLVPIIFYGTNVKNGSRATGGETVDVAPTLAAAAGVAYPTGLDGHPLSFVLNIRGG